jgi:hypothetical protein
MRVFAAICSRDIPFLRRALFNSSANLVSISFNINLLSYL